MRTHSRHQLFALFATGMLLLLAAALLNSAAAKRTSGQGPVVATSTELEPRADTAQLRRRARHGLAVPFFSFGARN